MDWLKQHADTIAIVITFLTCFWHLNEKISALEKDMTIVKTVLIMQKIMPVELCVNNEIGEKK